MQLTYPFGSNLRFDLLSVALKLDLLPIKCLSPYSALKFPKFHSSWIKIWLICFGKVQIQHVTRITPRDQKKQVITQPAFCFTWDA